MDRQIKFGIPTTIPSGITNFFRIEWGQKAWGQMSPNALTNSLTLYRCCITKGNVHYSGPRSKFWLQLEINNISLKETWSSRHLSGSGMLCLETIKHSSIVWIFKILFRNMFGDWKSIHIHQYWELIKSPLLQYRVIYRNS